MQAQHQSSSVTEATTNTFNVGDDVSYVVGRSSGYSVSFSVREGKIVKIDSDVAVIKFRNGRCCMQPLSKLTRKGERNALTRALLGSIDHD